MTKEDTYSGKNDQLEIIYVQPSNYQNEELIIDFNWIADFLDRQPGNDTFESELANALSVWAND